MANQKISELNSIGLLSLADTDVFTLVDTTAQETKKIEWSSLKIPPFIGCRLNIAANTTGIDITAGGITIVWDVESNDTHLFHDLSVNPDRIVIPDQFGGMFFDLGGTMAMENWAVNNDMRVFIRHFNAADVEYTNRGSHLRQGTNTGNRNTISWPHVQVNSADYFVFFADGTGDTMVDISTHCGFSCRLVAQ